ncbi:hypothetical protein BY996DRAFT_6499803 [Phakopsora pachyrhizi]|nr:hypothetical protein BY996DRAFT_6499803 [Phakopsora pachyrhizi]
MRRYRRWIEMVKPRLAGASGQMRIQLLNLSIPNNRGFDKCLCLAAHTYSSHSFLSILSLSVDKQQTDKKATPDLANQLDQPNKRVINISQ